MPPPQELPPWPDDPLSTFFYQAEYNTRGSAINYARVYGLLERANDLFVGLQDAVAQDNDQVLLIPRFFLIRARSAVLAASRLALSGQIPEAYPLFRSAIEYSWYALHIAKDPEPPTRARTWLGRGDSAEATRACKSEFTIARVRATHEAYDRTESEHLRQVYEGTIELGGHPNQVALFTSFTQTRAEERQLGYTVGILYPQNGTVLATLGFGLGLCVSISRLFGLIYPERFRIMQLDDRTDDLLRRIQQTLAQLQVAEP